MMTYTDETNYNMGSYHKYGSLEVDCKLDEAIF